MNESVMLTELTPVQLACMLDIAVYNYCKLMATSLGKDIDTDYTDEEIVTLRNYVYSKCYTSMEKCKIDHTA